MACGAEKPQVFYPSMYGLQCTRPTCSVEVGGASDADFLLAKLHVEQHGLVGLGPREVEARLQALSHCDAILEGALVEAVAGEL